MRYARVHLAGLGYELAPNSVDSSLLESRLAPVYEQLRLPYGQLEALTGVRTRRYWNPGQTMADAAADAGEKALAAAGIDRHRLGLLVYGGVCRDAVEPATACEVAHRLALPAAIEAYDVSNACLGVLNGVVQAANAIELGQIEAALVVSAESAREVVDATIDALLAKPTIDSFRMSLATLTGGSGAVGVVVAHESLAAGRHRLLGGVARSAPEHHMLCRWGAPHWRGRDGDDGHDLLQTHAVELLHAGVALGERTWGDFLARLGWDERPPGRVICHQVGKANQEMILKRLGIDPAADFVSYPWLGNIGTVSLPITLALAAEAGHVRAGDRVGLLGIASGLNCLMLGVEWGGPQNDE